MHIIVSVDQPLTEQPVDALNKELLKICHVFHNHGTYFTYLMI